MAAETMRLSSHYREVGTETKSMIGLNFFVVENSREFLSHRTKQLERKDRNDKSNLKGEKYLFKDIEAKK